MVNQKFYNVEIGTYSKKGNFTVLNSFVCKSQANGIAVENHYTMRYNGFSVRVNEITQIVSLDALKTQDNAKDFFANDNKDLKIRELEKELKRQKTTLVVKIGINDLNKSNADIYIQLKDTYYKYTKTKENLTKGLQEQIKEKYNAVYKNVNIENHFIGSDNYVQDAICTIELNGELK